MRNKFVYEYGGYVLLLLLFNFHLLFIIFYPCDKKT